MIRSRSWIFLFLLFFLTACEKKQINRPIVGDFESLMGKNHPNWKYVETREDFQNLDFFKKVYQQNISYLQKQEKQKIPQVIHFIWLGPKPFPRESVENVRTWIAHHPEWKIKFWTDRDRPLPHPKMEHCNIEEFLFKKLFPLYHQSNNYAEKSDLLRLEILYEEGGIYVDHDVKCLRSFVPFNRTFDLYCGMEMPYPTCLSSSLMPTNNLLGVKQKHLLLEKCMDWLLENWTSIEKAYPGQDLDAVISRIAHRTFSVLGINFKQFANQEGNIDIAFPTYYFNSPEEKTALFAKHQYKGTWFEKESDFEKKTKKRLMMLSKKTNKLLLAISILVGLNAIGYFSLIFMLHRKRNERS